MVAVHDRGVGIRESDPDRVFSAFFTTKPDGMGMGLSISRSIIEAHGGLLTPSPNPTKVGWTGPSLGTMIAADWLSTSGTTSGR
jgi:signal transduction histidine kinase